MSYFHTIAVIRRGRPSRYTLLLRHREPYSVPNRQPRLYKAVRPNCHANMLRTKHTRPDPLYFLNAAITRYNALYKHQFSRRLQADWAANIHWKAPRSFFRELHQGRT